MALPTLWGEMYSMLHYPRGLVLPNPYLVNDLKLMSVYILPYLF
jgi:hypothetical protein